MHKFVLNQVIINIVVLIYPSFIFSFHSLHNLIMHSKSNLKCTIMIFSILLTHKSSNKEERRKKNKIEIKKKDERRKRPAS